MDRRHLARIDTYVVCWGGLVVILAVFLQNLHIIMGAVLGSVLAIANWIAFRILAVKMAEGGKRLRFGVFLGLKTTLMFAAVAVVFYLIPVNPLAFIAGLSSLAVGIMIYSVRLSLTKEDTIVREDL